MAADGTITLATKVDPKGIKNSENTVKSAAKSMGAEFGKTGQQIQAALNGGDAKAQKLALSLQKATAQVDAQAKKVDELRAKLEGLKSGEIVVRDKGAAKLQSDFDKTNISIEKTKAEINSLYEELDRLQANAFKAPDTGAIILTGTEQAQFDSIYAKLDQLEPKLETDKQKANELGEALRNAAGTSTQAAIDAATAKLQQEEIKLDELKLKAQAAGGALRSSMTGANDSVNAITAGIDKFGNRLIGLAKRVFVFSVITKALRSVREMLGNALMADEGFRQSLYQLQGALWTAFAPIYSYILPAVKSLVNWITAAINAVLKFAAALTGKTFSSMAASGKALTEQTDAYKGVGASGASAAKGMKKATDEAKKQIAAFDELNILSEDKTDADAGAGSVGAGGGSAGGGSAMFGDDKGLPEAEERLKAILTLVTLIGAGIAAWKIADALGVFTNLAGAAPYATQIADSMSQAGTATNKLTGFLLQLVGYAMIIAGAFLLVKGYSDAWVSGIDWGNFTMILGGLALVVGGIALAFSPIAAAITLVAGGIALLVLGIKDFNENGATLQNVLVIIAGVVAIAAGAFWALAAAESAAAWPVALIVAAVAALVAGFVLLWNNCEGFRNFWTGLWEQIQQAAITIWEEWLKPALEEIWKLLQDLWKNILQPFFQWLGETLLWLWDNVGQPVIQWIGETLMWLWNLLQDLWQNILQPVFQWIGETLMWLWESVIQPVLKFIGETIAKLWNEHIKPFWENNLKPALQVIGEKLNELWENVIQPVIQWIGETLTWLWESVIQPVFQWIGETLMWLWNNILKPVVDWVVGAFVEGFKWAFQWIGDFIGTIIDTIGGIINGLVQVFSGIIDFIVGIFTGDWEKAWNGIKGVFTGIVNGIVSVFEGMINFIIDAINAFLGLVNGAVSGVGSMFGQDWNINLHIEHVKIPRLAQGAVLPPNKPFLAMVGDQKNGTNIEAPLQTIVDAVMLALDSRSENNGSAAPIQLILNGRELGRAVIDTGTQELRRTKGAGLAAKVVVV